MHLASALTEPTPDHFSEVGKVKPDGALLSLWAIAAAQECKQTQSTNLVALWMLKYSYRIKILVANTINYLDFNSACCSVNLSKNALN